MNAQYLSKLDFETLQPHLEPFLEPLGLTNADPARLGVAVNLHRSRSHTLKELAELIVPYFKDELAYDPEVNAKFLQDKDLPEILKTLRERYAALPAFDKESLEAALRALATERGLKAGALIHPTRMALSAAAQGPPLFDLVEAMGREASLRHLDHFLAFLKKNAQG
jgi:glutamyl/glutaminyl-tRNA synthetase